MEHLTARANLIADRPFPKDQLAWTIATLAAKAASPDRAPVDDTLVATMINHLIDNAALAAAALNHPPVISARDQALAHPYRRGATLFGLAPRRRISPEWAAWANGVAIRGPGRQGTGPTAGHLHLGDAIPGVVAVVQHCGLAGADLVRGLLAAHQAQANLPWGIYPHHPEADGIDSLSLSIAAGIGAALQLSVETMYRAVRLMPATSRQASSVAFAGKMAVEVVDRSLREGSGFSTGLGGADGFIAPLPETRGPVDQTPADPAQPGTRPSSMARFRALVDGIVHPVEQDRFLALAARLPMLTAEEVICLGFQVNPDILQSGNPGLFDRV
ncbi:MmgE/PrpD family protein [Nitrospirillum amazonense]|uniref:MmgE/PrpD family protein n=1 Tax=Nitrospirillum amazonense TaxID=28077 RepID=A0A560FP59_9PROT|nr:MmgE/PrpD family protein [Nitrospirillum amazonense]TWB23418.1 MmgE/PrpD family protein [Nitrospirillum amazonense]